ncbi:MAG: ACP S-malonyltransferase [Burkholderiales bacterium]|jgi:[acyl-carrier-protein] S-malonyltransferase|nr:ACP S-malonyltransferase [Burkholderiales bacterium]
MKLAFVFPGQGSQSIGMMNGFSAHPMVRRAFDEASEALGEDLWTMAAESTPEVISLTTNTQPLMLTADVAVWRAWRETSSCLPEIVAGHSLGEYAALVAAESLTLADAVTLVRFRADAMQRAVPEGMGAMAAILGLSDEAVISLCQSRSTEQSRVEAVNFNGPGQVVIAGHKTAVEALTVAAKEAGAKRAVILPVSAPFHSTLLAPAVDQLRERLKSVAIAPPKIALIHNVDVSEHQEPDAIREALATQAAKPVRWTETLKALTGRGVTHIVECGPGKVLAALNKRGAEGAQSFALTDSAAIDATHQTLLGAQ